MSFLVSERGSIHSHSAALTSQPAGTRCRVRPIRNMKKIKRYKQNVTFSQLQLASHPPDRATSTRYTSRPVSPSLSHLIPQSALHLWTTVTWAGGALTFDCFRTNPASITQASRIEPRWTENWAGRVYPVDSASNPTNQT